MKPKELKKLALLGLAAGALISHQANAISALEAHDMFDLNYVLAKPSCKGSGGCGGLTASRDLNQPVVHEDEEFQQDDNEQDEAEEITVPKLV